MKLFAIALVSVLVAVGGAKPVPSGKCALKDCVLKSPLASEGPGFADGLHFFHAGGAAKDTRAACPFSDDNDPEPSKKEYIRYMKGIGDTADMTPDQRRAYALEYQQRLYDKLDEEVAKPPKKPEVDVTAAGVEAVDRKTLDQLRTYNKHDLLVTFYAPWCPHCKNFVTASDAPIEALDAALERVNGPKVLKFDIQASNPPQQFGIDSVPTVYLFKTSGEAIMFTGDIADADALVAFATGKESTALVQKPHLAAESHTCALENCVLKSSLASKGPGFPDGVHFFAGGAAQDTRAACPFSDDNDPEPSKKEYVKYMKGIGETADMTPDQRRAYALEYQQRLYDKLDEEGTKPPKKPEVDVAAAGVEAVNSKTLDQLRTYNKHDFLVTFYAPWCPHCKKFVMDYDAPIEALDAALGRVNGPKVLKFDINESNPPGQLGIDSVPTVYLFKKTGEAIMYQGDVSDAKAMIEFATGKPAAALVQASASVAKNVQKHLRTQAM